MDFKAFLALNLVSLMQEVEVDIIDDDEYEDDQEKKIFCSLHLRQEFYIEITGAVCTAKGISAGVGEKNEATVVRQRHSKTLRETS